MFKFQNKLKSAFRIVVFGLSLSAAASCTAIYKNHGYVPTQEELAELKVGVDNRDTVLEAVGAPSATGVLKDSGYYYVASRVRHYGPKKPEIVSRELVAITFDQRGVVRNIERFGLEDGIIVPLDRRVTDSSVQDKGFLRQLLGNIGNYNPANIPGAS